MKLSALKRKSIYETLAWIIATWFGSGCSPKAPGTIGSFCSLPLVLIGLIWGQLALGYTILGLFLVGWLATATVLKTQKEQDPGFVVIDETVGQTMTFLLALGGRFAWYDILIGFALFRLFDIIKLWPASFFDRKVHTAFGVMMDDVIAGGYASLILYGLTFLI